MKAFIPIIIIAFFITGCSPKQPQPPKVTEQLAETSVYQTIETTANIQLEEIATNLQIPWSIEKVGETFYLSERRGNIVKVENGQTERQQVQFEKPLATAQEAGFLGFVLAPDFLQSNEAYGYYTYVDNTGQLNRTVRQGVVIIN